MSDPSTSSYGEAAAVSAETATTNISEEISEVLEERLIDAEYKIWKKNTPYLYDLVMTHSLEWPSLTCQWLPQIKSSKHASKTTEEHSLVIGTHATQDEMNYLMIASAILPKASANYVVNTFEAAQNENKPMSSYDDEKNEIGGFGFNPNNNGSTNTGAGLPPSTPAGKIDVKIRIPHKGEVNRARYMPQNHFWIASRGPDPEIYIWDLTKHESNPQENIFSPQLILAGHEAEGYGMCWNPHVKGQLLTASFDKTVCLWDVNDSDPLRGKAVGHTKQVEDVAWHHHDMNLVGSVGDDASIRLWDIRSFSLVHAVEQAHDGDINTIGFNPINEYLFATGSTDKTVGLWDVRNLKVKVQSLLGHSDQVFQLEWAGFNETILSSSSSDRRVCLWDLSRIGDEQTSEDAEDGPPELLFMHGGHTSTVSDISWNPNQDWTMASVSEDNILQVWNIAEEIYAGEDDDDAENEEGGPRKKRKEETFLGDDELE